MYFSFFPALACRTPASCRLTVQDVSQSLGAQQVLQTRHLVLQVPDQLVVGVFVDHRVALDVLGAVGVAVGWGGSEVSAERTSTQGEHGTRQTEPNIDANKQRKRINYP